MATTDLKPTSDPAFREIEISELGTYQLILNNAKSPFNNVRVRRAVSLALDYRRLAEKMNWSEDTLQAGLVPLGMRGFLKRTPADRDEAPKEATRLLKDAGYTAHHPLRFNVLFSSVPSMRGKCHTRRIFFLVRRSWQSRRSFPTLSGTRGLIAAISKLQDGSNTGALPNRTGCFFPDLSGSPFNPARSHGPKCDRLIEKSVSNQDREARFQLYSQADSCLMNQAILVPLASLQRGTFF